MKKQKALQVINLLPASKTRQDEFVSQVLSKVEEGEINPLSLETYLKAMEDVIKRIRKDAEFKESLGLEVDKHGEKEFRVGNSIVVKSSRTTWDYSADDKWKRLDKEKKDHEKLLKALTEETASTESGEVYTPPTPKKSEFLKIRFDDYNE